jgi:hypothetical protein
MSTVPSATAPSETSSSLWNIKNYLLLAGVGIVVYITYRYFSRESIVYRYEAHTDNRPDFIKTHFPHCTNINPTFPSEVPGIIRISLENLSLPNPRNPLELIFIEYTHDGKTFSMPMTVVGNEAEAYVRHLPYDEEVDLQFKYQHSQTAGLKLKVDQTFGIYQIYIEGGNWKVDSHPETPPQVVDKLNFDYTADASLSLSIDSSKLQIDPSPRRIKPESYYQLTNTTSKVHVLFLEIIGQNLVANPLELRLVIPITVFPQSAIALPQGFLKTCWEHTYRSTHGKEPPSNPKLTIMDILDTAAPDQL